MKALDIMSDADFKLAIINKYYSDDISNKPVDKSHDYGHGKYETLATAFIGMALLGVGFGILWNGATDILVFLRGGELRQPGETGLRA